MDCQKEGKTITVWTVNDESEMKECIRWGVRAIITDKPKVVVALREECKAKPEVLLQSLLQRLTLPWSKTEYFSFKTVSHDIAKAGQRRELIQILILYTRTPKRTPRLL